jgi:enterochelin esterase-like enzyme
MAIALTVIGLIGAYSYWESYYQHRGFAPVAFLPHARPGQREVVHFYSEALHREADYLVYLPPGYGNGTRYPVYYLLHGSPGRPEVFWGIASMPVRMDNLISLHKMRPMILVFPDGRIHGSAYSDSEWANTPSGNYASYVIDVVHDVDHRFDTIANRDERVIAGFSMGAYGATNILLQNLTVFGNLQSWSGYYIQTRSGVFGHASQATLDANSPLRYVHALRAAIAADPVRAFMFVGRDDNDSPQLMPMAEALAAVGGQVTFALYHGGHDWQLWHAHLDQMLELASRDTERPPAVSSGSIRSLTPGVVPIPHGLGRHRHARVVTAGAYTTVVVTRDRVRHRSHRRHRHRAVRS